MEREKEVGMAAVRNLYPPLTLCLTPTAAANGQEPAWIEAEPAERDASISVWWDHLPGRDPS
jgi:hypothetical protein